ncbi:MAG: tannase/feruloyl esterase family alpha/beta hydrolase [Bryobacteraceae bacterium]|jgi:feruloyl esterase
MAVLSSSTAFARTVADCFNYRRKIGTDVAIEALPMPCGSYSRGTATPEASANVFSGNLPEMPPLRVWSALRYAHRWVFAELGSVAVDRQSKVNSDLQETPMAGYALLNVKLGFTHRKLSGSFTVDNLLNRFYYEYLSYYRDPFAAGVKVREPGRNLSVQLRYSFSLRHAQVHFWRRCDWRPTGSRHFAAAFSLNQKVQLARVRKSTKGRDDAEYRATLIRADTSASREEGWMARAAKIASALYVLCSVAVGQTSAPPAACTALTRMQVPGVALTVTKAEWIPAGSEPVGLGSAAPATTLPAYCRLDGVIGRRTGAHGVAYGIGFALALPENWNGRFLFQGGAGLNGTVQPPLGASAAGSEPGLARGFAVASTDSGHKGGVFDASFMQDQQASLDFAYAAIGRVAEVAKRIIEQHYGKPADRSYFAGCSTGGREAMLMAQRYPTYFDGIIAGAPAMRTSFSHIGDRWVAATLNEIAPKDAQGLPVTREALSESDKKAVIEGLLNACDAADGLRDLMIFNTQACRFDPKTLVCKGPKAEGCLSMAQAAAIEKAFGGPRDSKGRQVYPGFLFDTGIASTRGVPGLLYGGANPVGPAFTDIGMDVDSAVERALADPAESLTATSGWTNLNTFSGHGGKLIFWHGASDPWFSALDTVDYYERMTKANGGPEQVRNWSRLYLVPGMGHCGGGPETLDNFDALSAIVKWVEERVAPESLTATGRAFPGRSRPLCAYPMCAHYKGQGDPEDAANFECRPAGGSPAP